MNRQLLAERIDKINGNNRQMASSFETSCSLYGVLSLEPSQIAKVTVIEHSGDTLLPPQELQLHGRMDTTPKETPPGKQKLW